MALGGSGPLDSHDILMDSHRLFHFIYNDNDRDGGGPTL